MKINKSILIGSLLAVLYNIYFAWSLYDFIKPPPGYDHSMASGDIVLIMIVIFPIIYAILATILFLMALLISFLPMNIMKPFNKKLKEDDALIKFVAPSFLIQILGEICIVFYSGH